MTFKNTLFKNILTDNIDYIEKIFNQKLMISDLDLKYKLATIVYILINNFKRDDLTFLKLKLLINLESTLDLLIKNAEHFNKPDIKIICSVLKMFLTKSIFYSELSLIPILHFISDRNVDKIDDNFCCLIYDYYEIENTSNN